MNNVDGGLSARETGADVAPIKQAPKVENGSITQRAKDLVGRIRLSRRNPDEAFKELAKAPHEKEPQDGETLSTDTTNNVELGQETEVEPQVVPNDPTKEISEDERNENSFANMNGNILALADKISRGEGDVDGARKVLGDLLRAREKFYLDIARSINPDIQQVEGRDNLYRIAGTEVYGSITSILDATPVLATNKQLAERLKIKLPEGEEVVAGENIPPRALIEASVVFSGSSAQDRVQHYPGDRDMAEHVRIHADTAEEAAGILARGLQSSVDQEIVIALPGGKAITLHFSGMALGGEYPPDAELAPGASTRMSWSIDEIKLGYKEYKSKSGEVKRISMEQSCLNPQFIKADYLGVSDDTVMEVTKVTTVQATDQDGKLLVSNDPNRADAFQEVYFDDPTGLGLMEVTSDPDKFVSYMRAMSEQVKLYSGSDHMNGIKASKRLYNLLKVQGDIGLAQEVSQIFNTQGSKVSQLVDRLGVSVLAQERGIDVSAQQSIMRGELQGLLTTSTDPLAAGALTLLEQGDLQHNLDQLRTVSMSIINSEYQQFLLEHPRVKERVDVILGS